MKRRWAWDAGGGGSTNRAIARTGERGVGLGGFAWLRYRRVEGAIQRGRGATGCDPHIKPPRRGGGKDSIRPQTVIDSTQHGSPAKGWAPDSG